LPKIILFLFKITFKVVASVVDDLLSNIEGLGNCEVDFTVQETKSQKDMMVRRDKLGREHICYSRTGPLTVVIRNGIFHHLTMEVNYFSS